MCAWLVRLAIGPLVHTRVPQPCDEDEPVAALGPVHNALSRELEALHCGRDLASAAL